MGKGGEDMVPLLVPLHNFDLIEVLLRQNGGGEDGGEGKDGDLHDVLFCSDCKIGWFRQRLC